MNETAIILLMLIFFILGHITGRRWEQFKQEDERENDRAIQDAMRLQSKRGYPTEEHDGR